MSNNALYVYGIVKFDFELDLNDKGLDGANVYMISNEKFSALVHDCEEKPYTSEDPNKIKELIIRHNNILDIAMEYFGGVMPLHFNTIVKKGDNSAQDTLKKWLNNENKRLERVWHKIMGKKEFGIRIYYDNDKLIQDASNSIEIKEIEESAEGKSPGLNYLLQGKLSSKIDEIVQNRINQYKLEFYNEIGRITKEIIVNTPRISIDEERDLLFSLCILINGQQIDKIREILDKKSNEFPFQFTGPFAPYSFVENETAQ